MENPNFSTMSICAVQKTGVLFFPVFLLMLTTWSCNPKEKIPAYIRIEPWVVNAPGGAAQQDLKEAWVFVGNDFRGAYPVPGEVPVLLDGTSSVEIFPGISENGIRNTPNIYTPLNKWVGNVNLVAGETVTVTPSTAYVQNIKTPLAGQENFDNPSSLPFLDEDGDDATFLIVTDQGGKFGRHMQLKVDTAHPQNGVSIAQFMDGLPVTGGQEVWLELHHQNDVRFDLFLVGANRANPSQKNLIPVYTFNQSTDWNKIYINLTPAIIENRYELHTLAIQAFLDRNTAGNYIQSEGVARIDNIKIVHF